MTGLEQALQGHLLGKFYEFSMFRKMCFGAGAASKVGEIAKDIAKNNNAIIVTDDVLVKLGIIDDAKKSLKEAGFSVDIVLSPSTDLTSKASPNWKSIVLNILSARNPWNPKYGFFIAIASRNEANAG